MPPVELSAEGRQQCRRKLDELRMKLQKRREAAEYPGFEDAATTKTGQRLLVFINEEFAQKLS